MPYTITKNQDRIPAGKTRFQFHLTHHKVKHRKTVVCQRSAVQKFYREWENEITSGAFQYRDFMLFEILDKYLEYAKEKKVEKQFNKEMLTVRLLKTAFKDMRLANFKRPHIEIYISWRRKNPIVGNLKTITNATINREVGIISYFFNYCIVREYYNGVNPCFKTKLKENNQREIRLTADQITELLSKAEKQGRVYTAVLIALLTGLRRNELFNLRWTDIDFDNSLIYLRAATCKSHKGRAVSIPDYLKAHLTALRKENPFTEKIFSEYKTFNKLRFEWERLRETLTFKELSNGLQLHFHDLRHIYAQSLRDAGVSLDDIQILLGHSSVKVTESRYAQFGGRDALSKVNKIAQIIPLRSVV